jgi:hypothetical protein
LHFAGQIGTFQIFFLLSLKNTCQID